MPHVSISCITYNHKRFIRECLDGFLMQKTSFAFEVVIHDDASTDGTKEIIEEYASKYPDIIFPMFQNENQWSQGIRGMMARFILPRCRGQYIAICEGDDYWTDPLKLQKQVDYLEKNQNCSLCFHASTHFKDKNPGENYIHRPKFIPADNKFKMKHAILGGGSFITTNSMMFKREYVKDLPDWYLKAPVGDLPLMLLLAAKGRLGFIDEVMSAYRLMSVNSWSSNMQTVANKKKHFYAIHKMWDDFDQWTKYRFFWLVFRKKIKNRYSYWKQVIYLRKQKMLVKNKI